jgi:hypothetical protein
MSLDKTLNNQIINRLSKSCSDFAGLWEGDFARLPQLGVDFRPGMCVAVQWTEACGPT